MGASISLPEVPSIVLIDDAEIGGEMVNQGVQGVNQGACIEGDL